jgi:arylsulfatase A-like enzyme
VISVNLSRAHRECGTRPTFVLANYMDAHSPYLAPSPHAGLFAGDGHPNVPLTDAEVSDREDLLALKRARCDEEPHFLDQQLGLLFETMERDGVLGDSSVFVTADHGEAFFEHGATSHGSSICNEEVRGPLIVKPPRGVELSDRGGPVSLIDVAATIAGVAGASEFGAGRDLRKSPIIPPAIGIEIPGDLPQGEPIRSR